MTEPSNRIDRLRRIDQLFAAALNLDTAERASFLDRECSGDPELRETVADLLLAEEEGRLAVPTLGGEGARLRASLSPSSGDEIGRYRLVREIGRGGMGVVYLAERADGAFDRQVALKVLRIGSDPNEALRFEQERQILAEIDHAGIARLLDGGVTDEGLPYLVVEHVEGADLVSHCEIESVSLEDRIGLLIEVCEAVEAAHRRLIVHRDLKPSNILVSKRGKVKLLDFGIAKLLEPTDDEAPLLTRTGSAVMTLQYASPEQVRMESVTVASDVYQIGLLAYELLAGVRPYDLSGTSASQAEHLICEVEPQSASRAAAASTEEADRQRSASISRDLDAVLAKALRKEPERRYRSVDRLREDFERYLAGLPVAARPATAAYRLTKFARRHAVAVATTAAVLLAALVSTAVFTHRLARERDRRQLEAERAVSAQQLAEELRGESDEVVSFLVGLFEANNPERSGGRPRTARELLDQGAADLEHALTDRPRVRGRLLETMGKIYQQLGAYDRAEELLLDALESLSQSEGEEVEGWAADVQNRLGYLYFVDGRWQEARPLLESSIATWRRLDGGWRIGQVANSLAAVLEVTGDLDRAESLYQETLELAIEEFGPEHPSIANVLNNQANLAMTRGHYKRAAGIYERAYETAKKAYGTDDPRLGSFINNLGLLYGRLGQDARALEMLERSYRYHVELHGEDHPLSIEALGNVGLGHLKVGDFESADVTLNLTLERLVERLGPDHPSLIMTLNNLAQLRMAQNRDLEALEHLEAAATLTAANYGADSNRMAIVATDYGRVLTRLGRLEEAERQLDLALSNYKAQLQGESGLWSWAWFRTAELRIAQGRREEAESYLRDALALQQSLEGPEGSDRRVMADFYAAFLREAGRTAEAEEVERLVGLPEQDSKQRDP